MTISYKWPALFDPPIGLRIEELLKFRHVFRNIYKSPLVPAKVEFANQAAHDLAEDFGVYHERFLGFLQTLIAELDGDEFAVNDVQRKPPL